jgi:DUF4097 and DUF4098 domain-containing protein YvlB
MKKLAVIAAAFGLVFGVTGVVGYATVHGSYSTYTIDKTKTIKSDDISNIQFDSSLSGVHIYPTKSDKITVHIHGGTARKNIVFTVDANGNTANIEIRDKTERLFNFFPFEFITNNLKVKLEVPQKVYNHFQAHSKAGSITMEQMAANHFDLHSSAGSINVENSKGDLTAHASAGSMKMINMDGTLNLTDSAGSIDVQLKSITHDITAESSAGSVRIVTQQEPKALQMNLHTSAGHVDLNLPGAAFTTKEHDNVIGTIGSGGPMVQLGSSAGSVSIKKQ